MKKKKFTKIMVVLLAMVMMFSLPIEAAAAANVTAVTSIKKAKKVKTGKTTVTTPKDTGKTNTLTSYVKFTAPATKTYKFTFNNLRKYGRKSSQTIESAWISFYTLGKNGLINYVKFKQNEMKSYETLWLCSQESWVYGKTKKIKAGTFIPSRTASIRLKKGQTIYIVAGNINYKRCIDLTIK